MKVCEEFFRQGDYERQLNLPVTPVCDRYATSVPRIQTGKLTPLTYPHFTPSASPLPRIRSHPVALSLNSSRNGAQSVV